MMPPTMGTNPIHHHQPVRSVSCRRRTDSEMPATTSGIPMMMSRTIPTGLDASETRPTTV
jgi:hypothetical protein